MASVHEWLRCQCENGNCDHGDTPCKRQGVRHLQTIYGKFWMCRTCYEAMPDEYRTQPNYYAGKPPYEH